MKTENTFKIYGPYKRDDGRKYVCVLNKLGKKTTVCYPEDNDCDINFLKILENRLKIMKEKLNYESISKL